jgi:murein DD-endopeptidase
MPAGATLAARAAATAQSMVGEPYRWGGHSPGGFDCSGLVYYSYGRAGAEIPRTSSQLFRSSRPIPLTEVRAGDLVFFRVAGKASHVGIYLDDGRFVHAPSSGKRVNIASLREGWYARHFLRAGRLDVKPRLASR